MAHFVRGSTAAVLMHHSRTASGYPLFRQVSSGVTPATVITSRIVWVPVGAVVCTSSGSMMASRFIPSPVPIPADQVAWPAVVRISRGNDRHVEHAPVAAQRGGAVEGNLGDPGVACRRASGDPCALPGAREASHTALQVERRRAGYQEAKVKV